jgi:hypothetical protein
MGSQRLHEEWTPTSPSGFVPAGCATRKRRVC